jgi:hypothetical protein
MLRIPRKDAKENTRKGAKVTRPFTIECNKPSRPLRELHFSRLCA